MKQHYIGELTRCIADGKNLNLRFNGEDYTFHCGKKAETQKILDKIKGLWEKIRIEKEQQEQKEKQEMEAQKAEQERASMELETEQQAESNYESEQTDYVTAAESVGETLAIAVALYDFASQEEDEMAIEEAEKVIILDSSDAEWWLCSSMDGNRQGMIPASYLEVWLIFWHNYKGCGIR